MISLRLIHIFIDNGISICYNNNLTGFQNFPKKSNDKRHLAPPKLISQYAADQGRPSSLISRLVQGNVSRLTTLFEQKALGNSKDDATRQDTTKIRTNGKVHD